jgi:hypothetical protein
MPSRSCWALRWPAVTSLSILTLLLLSGSVQAAPGAEIKAEKWIVFAPTKQQLNDFQDALRRASHVLDMEIDWHAVIVWPSLPAKELLVSFHPRARVLGMDDPSLADLALLSVATQDDQESNGSVYFSIMNTHMRRMVGYLFAIQQGARMLFDGDLSAHHTTARALDSLAAPGTFAFFSSPLNPYAYFGQPSLWPRGISSTIARTAINVTSCEPDQLAADLGACIRVRGDLPEESN